MIYYPKALAAAWEKVVPADRFGGYSDDFGKPPPIELQTLAASYAPGVAIEPVAVVYNGEAVSPKIAVTGLPRGLAFKNGSISGTPAGPGESLVTITVTAGGEVVETLEAKMTVLHYADELVASLETAYGPFVPGVPVAMGLTPVLGWNASGLPAGLKFDVKTGLLTGTPKTPGVSIVYFKKKMGPSVHVVSTTFAVAPLRKVVVAVEGLGSVKGEGAYAANAVAKLTAKPGKGYAVVGWYRNGTCVSRASTYSYAVGTNEVQTLTVKFAPILDDVVSLKCSLGGVMLAADAALLCVTNYQGVAVELPVAFDALTQPTLKASGLPAGLAFKDGAVTGVPTVVSKVDRKSGELVPTTATFTLKTLAGSAAKYQVRFVVLPRARWASGTYTGAWLVKNEIFGAATFTLPANGKGAGRITYASNGRSATATLSSSALATYDERTERATFEATLKGSGLETRNVRLTMDAANGLGRIGLAEEGDDALALVQDIWKLTGVEVPTFPSGRAALAVETMDGLVLTFGQKGGVKFAGSIAGDDGKPVSVSGSTVVQTIDNEVTGANGQVLVYAPAKKNLANGYARLVPLRVKTDEAKNVVAVEVVESVGPSMDAVQP